MNRVMKEVIYKEFIWDTWIFPPKELGPKMAFYIEHFLQLRDGLIIRPKYTHKHWIRNLKISLANSKFVRINVGLGLATTFQDL